MAKKRVKKRSRTIPELVESLAAEICDGCKYKNEYTRVRDRRNLEWAVWHGKEGHSGSFRCNATKLWNWLADYGDKYTL